MTVRAGVFDRILLLAGGYLLVLTPIALVLLAILYCVLRRLDRTDPLSRSDSAQIALLMAYPAAWVLLFLLAEVGPTRPVAAGIAVSPFRLVSLYGACGGWRGAQRLLQHWREPAYGLGENQGEVREMSCPEFIGQPNVWGNR